jgi:hypothetical protein
MAYQIGGKNLYTINACHLCWVEWPDLVDAAYLASPPLRIPISTAGSYFSVAATSAKSTELQASQYEKFGSGERSAEGSEHRHSIVRRAGLVGEYEHPGSLIPESWFCCTSSR